MSASQIYYKIDFYFSFWRKLFLFWACLAPPNAATLAVFQSIKTLNSTISNPVLFIHLTCKTINTSPFKVSPLIYWDISIFTIVFLEFLFSWLRKFWKIKFRLIWRVVHNLHFREVFYYNLWITNSIIFSDLFVRFFFSTYSL